MYNEALSENLAVVATIDPDAYAAAAYNSDIIDMKLHRRVLFIVQAGELGASATLDFKVQEGAASDLSDAADLTGKAITQLTKAGTDDDKQALVEVTAEEVAAAGGRYIRGVMTVGTAASDCGLLALAAFSRYGDAAANDLSTVDEIVQ